MSFDVSGHVFTGLFNNSKYLGTRIPYVFSLMFHGLLNVMLVLTTSSY